MGSESKTNYKNRFLRLRNRLIGVFTFAVTIVLIVLFIQNERLSDSIREKENISRLINISGRQRMLSQNLAKTSLLLLKDSTDRSRYESTLDSLLGIFKSSHHELKASARDLSSEKLNSMFAELDTSFVGLSEGCEQMSVNPSAYETVLEYERSFLPQMDAIVNQYEQIGVDIFRDTNRNVSLSNYLVGMMVVLSASGVLILTILIVRSYSGQLEKKSIQLEGANNRLNAFFQSTGDLIYELDGDSNYQFVNKTVERITGLKTEELGKKKFWDFVPEGHKEQLETHFKEVLKSRKRSDYYEFPIRGKEGLIWLGQSVDYVYENDRVVKAYAIAKDITSSKKAAEEQIQLLSSFIELQPAAVAMFDRDIRYVAVSQKWLNVYRLKNIVKGLSHFKLFPEDYPLWKDAHERVLNGEVVKEDEVPFKREDGRIQYIKWEARPWYGRSKNEVEGFIMFTDDVTSVVEQREALVEAKKSAEAAAKIKEQFAYIASHDLKEPVRTIVSLTDMMTEEYKAKIDEEGNQMLTFIHESGQRMSRLIDGLLDYSRLGKDQSLDEVDLNVTLEEIEKDLGDRISKNNAQLKVESLPTVTGYPIELRSLFQNLVSNAIKFKKEDQDPVVKVSALEETDCWRFSVEDNGIGIDPGFQDKIFQIFQRLNKRHEYEGMGIGLANCQRIAEIHRGKIWVNSELGKGAVFRFTISKDLA